jgi:ankyrin repeat protein
MTRQALPNHLNPDGQPPLSLALAAGHGKVVEVLLKNGADHTYTDRSGNTLLHVVAGKGNYDALKVFLKSVKLPEINHQNKDGDTALMTPASRGYSIIVECLLQHNADPNIRNKVGRTPIMAAARKGHKEVIKVLLKHGADILLTSYHDYSGMPTALKEAMDCGSADVSAFVTLHCNLATERVERLFTCKTREEIGGLINSGLSVNHRKGDGSTPLMVHAESGNVAVVTTLLEAQAFIDTQDKNGQTALMKSSFRGELEVVKVIVTKGALINIQCKLGRTALMYCVLGRSLEITKYLVQSGADVTISDHNECTAQNIAEQEGCMEIHTYLKGRSSTRPTEVDPFTAQVTQYLRFQKQQSTSQPQVLQLMARGPADGSSAVQHGRPDTSRPTDTTQSPVEGAKGHDDDDTVTKELHKSMKRIAELETRVEELTIRAEFSVADEEDLSYYKDQPDRLIDEFKKMKATKKKAEQFAIEAKQSAQKASVELSHVQEDLLREKHSNELRTKSFLSAIERRASKEEQSQRVSAEKEKAYLNVIRAFQGQKSPEEIEHLTAQSMPRRMYSPEQVLDVIVNSETKYRFKVALVAVSGLPDSGKSKLIQNLIPNTMSLGGPDQPGLAMYEIGYCATGKRNAFAPKWEEFMREDIDMYMLARALADQTKASEELPMLEKWDDQKLPVKHLSAKNLQTHFKSLYMKMHDGLLRFFEADSDFRYHVMSEPAYVFLNVWDIGVSKALHESLPLIARLINPLVLLDLFQLPRDGKQLKKAPELQPIHEAQSIMKGRSRGHYCIRIAGLCKSPGCSILIATCKDKASPEDLQRSKLVEAGLRAKASDMGVGKSLHPDMLVIDVHNDDDCKCVKRVIEDLVNSNEVFNTELRLTWIFLRTALLHYESESTFRIPRADFDNLARQCGLKSSEEIDECLKFFTKVGSLLAHEVFFRDSVIHRPYNFFKEVNKIYEEKGEHAEQSLEKGILCKAVAKKLWGGDQDFFWQLLQDAGVAAPTSKVEGSQPAFDFSIKCPYDKCHGEVCLFVPTLPKERMDRSVEIRKDSLFITFSSQYVPVDFQAQFVRHLRILGPDFNIRGVQLIPDKYYNSTEFKLLHNKGNVHIIVHGDVVEIITNNIEESADLEITSMVKSICVKMLDTALEYTDGFEYQLGFICSDCSKIVHPNPPNQNSISYLYFLPSQYETQLFCQKCVKMKMLSPEQLKWMRASVKDVTSSVVHCCEARMMDEQELLQVTRHIPLDHYVEICAKSGRVGSQTTPSEDTLVAVLMAWQQDSPNNRRNKLARVLLSMGCYRVALKLDAKLLEVCKDEVPPTHNEEVVSEMELETICNFAVDWKKLATALDIPKSQFQEIERESRGRERCRRVLQTRPIARRELVQSLREMGWTGLADGLEFGQIGRYTHFHH